MSNKKKLLKGFKNTHFAPFKAGTFSAPIKIDNAKKVEAKLNYEADSTWGDDSLIDSDFMFAGGEGKLEVLGLTKEEFNALYASEIVKGGIAVKTTDVSPEGAFLFERQKKGGAKRLYVIYACKCSPASLNAEGIEEGKGSAGTDEIEFSIGETEDNLVYHFIDTDDTTVSQEAITGWYTQVQMPAPIAQEKVKAVKE